METTTPDLDSPTDVSDAIELEADDEAATYYPDLTAFVDDYLAIIYDLPLGNTKRAWCPQWWKHAGAYARLNALWLAWESMRSQDGPTGMAAWFVNYADPIMATVFDPEGPFKGCSPTHGHRRDGHNDDGKLPTDMPDPSPLEPRD